MVILSSSSSCIVFESIVVRSSRMKIDDVYSYYVVSILITYILILIYKELIYTVSQLAEVLTYTGFPITYGKTGSHRDLIILIEVRLVILSPFS